MRSQRWAVIAVAATVLVGGVIAIRSERGTTEHVVAAAKSPAASSSGDAVRRESTPASPSSSTTTSSTASTTTTSPGHAVAGSDPSDDSVGVAGVDTDVPVPSSSPQATTSTTTHVASGPPINIQLSVDTLAVPDESMIVWASMYGIGAWFSIDYGDGTTGVASSSPWSCNYWGQPPYAAHAWSRPGRYVITVTAHGSSDCTTPLEDWVTAQTVQTVDVQERHETGSNGPALPRVTWESTDRCRLSLEVVDDDGAIYEELVDWGDGTPTERKQMSGSFVGDTYHAAGGRHIYAQSFPTDLASVTVTIISRGADKQSYQSSPPLRYDVPTRCYPDDYSTG